ncbi:sensor histidine kinase [Litorimonas sp. RW-G-Af-16]|uniref:sensor histidine kinase n=1 Tax=Litorimonas sp. RW-G-Af-16 TaxID=3241168 RepID=UPI00390C62E3
MIDRFISKRLSSKLLLLTIGFVLLAELFLFVPSAAIFRQDWLAERAQQAGLLSEALTGVPGYEASDMLTKRFMEDTDVVMMAAKRDGMTELVLGSPPTDVAGEMRFVDLREKQRLPRFRDAFIDFFGPAKGYIRVLAASPVEGQEALELIIPREKLRWAMRDFFERILLLSLLIAFITGALIYFSMAALIIRPVQKLANDMTAFRDAPQLRRNLNNPRFRQDEIGQLEREFFDMKQSLRAAFRQRERLAGLGLAVAKINHDLRNVLTSALLISDRLSMNTDPKVKDMGEKLTRTVERGVSLSEDVLAYSRADTADPEPQHVRLSFLLGEVAADVLEQFPFVDFANQVPSELTAFADPDHAYRIFHNLFRNAAQAMKDSRERQITVAADTTEERVMVTLTDTGPGLPERARENLFQAFKGGQGVGSTGLGLSISKELAEAQGGDLELIKSDENGTQFMVTFPRTG